MIRVVQGDPGDVVGWKCSCTVNGEPAMVTKDDEGHLTITIEEEVEEGDCKIIIFDENKSTYNGVINDEGIWSPS